MGLYIHTPKKISPYLDGAYCLAIKPEASAALFSLPSSCGSCGKFKILITRLIVTCGIIVTFGYKSSDACRRAAVRNCMATRITAMSLVNCATLVYCTGGCYVVSRSQTLSPQALIDERL